jgi:glyoxylase-like metal-dependent hydrolase (beta-lactamase superfamily II)/rhodanese-related sulfurtransferase
MQSRSEMKSNLKSGEHKAEPLEIDVIKLKEKLDKGEDVFILDVRTPEEHNAWKFSYDRYQKTPVIPIDKLTGSQNVVSEQIPKDKEIVTVCAHGQRSQMAAQMLSKMGYKVKNIKGGMAAWNQVYDVASLPKSSSIPTTTTTTHSQEQAAIWQLRRVSKGCMGYVIAVGNAATVIDSTCDLDNSALRLAEDNGLKIVNVIDTHMHADHVSGLSALVKRTGANAYISAEEEYEPAASDLGIEVNLIKDNQKIPIGNNVSLTAIHTPGHTEGSMSFVLDIDKAEGQKHYYLFTGDTLFVNAVGRPDLHNKAGEFAAKLYDTYQSKILQYPDNAFILPAHFDTDSITVKHNELISETIGSIKRKVKLLSIPKNDFIEFMVSSVPPRPANYEKIIQINKGLIPCNRINIGDLEEGPNSCAIRM